MLKSIKKRWKKIKKRHLPKGVAFFAQLYLKLVLKTCKIQVTGLEFLNKGILNGKCIVMLWHNRLTPVVHLLKYLPQDVECAALISNSRDGEILTRLVGNSKLKVIRVVHDSKHNALKDAIQSLNNDKRTLLVITPDGPRGPRYVIKPGISMAAKIACAPIMPLSWSASNFWQLRTWDKLIIPKPFSRIIFHFGDLIQETESSHDPKKLEQALLDLDKQACASITDNQHKWPS